MKRCTEGTLVAPRPPPQLDNPTQPHDPKDWLHERETVSSAVRARGASIAFIHVYKSGGTSLCEAARMAGMRTVQSDTCLRSSGPKRSGGVWADVYGKNCNPTFADRHDAWGGNGPDAMLAFARKLDFFAIETVRPSLLPWGQVALLVIVRHPLHRLISRCTRLKEMLLKQPKSRSPLLPVFGRMQANVNATGVATEADAERPCFCEMRGTLIETLAGIPGGGVDPLVSRASSVTREAVARASRLLERSSVVLTTDRLAEAGPVLSACFGWHVNVPKLSPFAAMLARSRGTLAMRPGRRLQGASKRGSSSAGTGEGEGAVTHALMVRFSRAAPRLHAEYLRDTTHELAVYEYASRHFSLRLARAIRSNGSATPISSADIAAEARLWATAPDRAWTAATPPTPLGDCPSGAAAQRSSVWTKLRDAMFSSARARS